MSEENLARARSAYEAWNSADLEALLKLAHPDIEVDYTAGVFPGIDQTYRGHEGVRRFWHELRGPWNSISITSMDVRGRGNKVAAVFTFEGQGREGIVVRREVANVMTFTDGLVSRIEAYGDPGAALEAAGLSE
jgi:ketosteroid isomerase-like protein